VDATISGHLRWIPKGMNIRYMKKARGRLSGRSWIDPGAFAPGDRTVPVEICDGAGDVVVKADIMLSITRRPESRQR